MWNAPTSVRVCNSAALPGLLQVSRVRAFISREPLADGTEGHSWNHWANNRAPAERCEIPSPACMQEKSQVFCGSGDDRSYLTLAAQSRHQLALPAPGMVPAAALGGLWDAVGIPHPAAAAAAGAGHGRERFPCQPCQRTTGAGRSWVGCAANGAGKELESWWARPLQGDCTERQL